MEIATEPLIRGSWPQKSGCWVSTHGKPKSYKSSSGLVGKPQEARLSRTFFLSCVSLTLLLSHHCSFGCTSSQPHGVPSATTMDLERGWGGQAWVMLTSGLTQFLPASFTKGTGVRRCGQKTYPAITPETQTQPS